MRELVTEKTKAILPVHLYGQPCDLDPLLELGLPVVEDAAHAFESRYRGRKIGSISDATCFSLYATKNVAAGEGGLISTNRDEVAARVNDLRVMRRGHGSLYDIAVPGYKANLSDVLATIALVQLDKLERHGEIRRRHFALYDEAVAELDGIEPVARDPRDTHAHHLYVVRVDPERAGATRDDYQQRARRGEHRHVDPLPAGAHADRLPRPRAARAAAGDRAGRAPRCCRCRSRPRTPTTTCATRWRRSSACTRASPHEPPRRCASARASSSPGSRPGTSSRRPTSARGATSSATRTSAYFAAALAITVATVPPMAWRWQLLLAARGIEDGVGWLTRAYFTSYTAGQILPTSIGGDAMRIFETSRRHPGRGGPVAGSVLLERALGGAATLLLAAVGFALAIGRYPVGPYLWVELAFVVATIVLGVVLFSRAVRPLLRRAVPLAARRAARAAAARRLRGDPRLPRRSRALLGGGRRADGRRRRPCACSRSGWRARRSASTSRRGRTT